MLPAISLRSKGMEQQFGMKELYFAQLKTTSNIEIDGNYLAPGETIATFDKIQISQFKEMEQYIAAVGGYENREWVIWRRPKELDLVFTQGIFNKAQFALMTNARLGKFTNEKLLVSQREFLETDENGILTLSHAPYRGRPIFIYKVEDGTKALDCTMHSENQIQTSLEAYTDVIIDYTYIYDASVSELTIGQEMIDGFLTFEGRTRVKDDVTGNTRTGIIKIPKLKLTSDLSISLGTNANPQVGRFDAKAMPIGERGQTRLMEFYFLSNDIDSDF